MTTSPVSVQSGRSEQGASERGGVGEQARGRHGGLSYHHKQSRTVAESETLSLTMKTELLCILGSSVLNSNQ